MASFLGQSLGLSPSSCSSLQKSDLASLRNGEGNGATSHLRSKHRRLMQRNKWMVSACASKCRVNEVKTRGGIVTRRGMVGLIALVAPSFLASAARGEGIDSIGDHEQPKVMMVKNSKKLLNSSQSTVSANGPALPIPKDATSAVLVDEMPARAQDVGLADSVSQDKRDEAMGQLSAEKQPGNPLSFLNNLGVVGSGILGALYWLEGRAKATSNSALEEANARVKQTETAMKSLQEELEASLLAQKEESLKDQARFQQDRANLLTELDSTKALAMELQKQLDAGKAFINSLEQKAEKFQRVIAEIEQSYALLENMFKEEQTKVASLEGELSLAKEHASSREQNTKNLNLALEKQKLVTEELTHTCEVAHEALKKSKTQIQKLEGELASARQVFADKETEVRNLEGRLVEAIKEHDGVRKELVVSHAEFDQALKSANQRIELLTGSFSSKEKEAERLTSKLASKTIEFDRASVAASDLENQVQVLKHSLVQEQTTVQRLTQELEGSSFGLETALEKVDTLGKELADSEKYSTKLERKISENQSAADSKMASLSESLANEHATVKQLKTHLGEIKSSLKESLQQSSSLNLELEKTTSTNQKLTEDLEQTREAANSRLHALSQQRQKTAAAEKQVLDIQKAVLQKEELVARLRTEFDKGMESMESLKAHLRSLSRDLEAAKSRTLLLEDEKKALQESLVREKRAAKRFKDKAAQVETLFERVLQEKESSARRTQKLEGDLATAKAEIVNLSEQIQVTGQALESAESRIESIARVGAEATSLVEKFEVLASDLEEKEALQSQKKQLKRQSNIVTEIAREIKSMKSDFSNLKESIEGIELAKAEAESAINSFSESSQEIASKESQVLVEQVAAEVDV